MFHFLIRALGPPEENGDCEKEEKFFEPEAIKDIDAVIRENIVILERLKLKCGNDEDDNDDVDQDPTYSSSSSSSDENEPDLKVRNKCEESNNYALPSVVATPIFVQSGSKDSSISSSDSSSVHRTFSFENQPTHHRNNVFPFPNKRKSKKKGVKFGLYS